MIFNLFKKNSIKILFRGTEEWMLVSKSGIHGKGSYECMIHKYQVMTQPDKFNQSDLNRDYEPYQGKLYLCKVYEVDDE